MSLYPRTEYQMTQEDLNMLLDACKPVPYIVIGGHAPSSPQENANGAWADLGLKMGFDPMTVRPIEGKDVAHFSAVPTENETQRQERIEKEAHERRLKEIEEITLKMNTMQARLSELLKSV